MKTRTWLGSFEKMTMNQMRYLAAALLIAAMVAGCKAARNQGTTPEADEHSKRSSDAWNRMKDCAAQADRLARRHGWVEGRPDPDIPIGVNKGWQNHYSETEQRCYVLVSYGDAGSSTTWLMDAYEDSVEASEHLFGDNKRSCMVGGQQEECDKLKRYIDARMTR